MDVYNDKFIKFWSALNTNNVEYMMVGGVAANLNGYQRTTDDRYLDKRFFREQEKAKESIL